VLDAVVEFGPAVVLLEVADVEVASEVAGVP